MHSNRIEPDRSIPNDGEMQPKTPSVGGIVVHIGSRIGALARKSEVLVSSTVKDLTASSGLPFVDRGEHQLKGYPRHVASLRFEP